MLTGSAETVTGQHPRQFQDDGTLSAGVIAARRIGSVVKNIRRARIVMPANNHETIRIPSWQPGDHIVGWGARTDGMGERVKPDLKSGNRAVLTEEEVARGSHATSRLRLVGTGLPGPEVLQRAGSVQNTVRIHIADDAADFRVCGHASAGGKA